MTATATPRSDVPEYEEYAGEEMTLVEHLRELRSRLFKSVFAIVAGLGIGFAFSDRVLEILSRPYCNLPDELRRGTDALAGPGADCALISLKVLDPFFVVLKASAIVAVVIAAPVVCYQILRFVTPGLRPVERRYSIPFIIATQALFALGAVFSFFVVPRALEFLLGFAPAQFVPVLNGNDYLTFVLRTMMGFGIAFEFPLVLMILSLMGIVTAAGLRGARRYAIFGTFVAGAVLTPGGDPISMMFLALPLVAFYEISAVFAWFVERRRARAEATLAG